MSDNQILDKRPTKRARKEESLSCLTKCNLCNKYFQKLVLPYIIEKVKLSVCSNCIFYCRAIVSLKKYNRFPMLTTIDEEKISIILNPLDDTVSFISHIRAFQKTLLCIKAPCRSNEDSRILVKRESESFSVGLNNNFFNLCSAFASIDLESNSVSEKILKDFQSIDFCTAALSVLRLSYELKN